jgi:hypothetical protein
MKSCKECRQLREPESPDDWARCRLLEVGGWNATTLPADLTVVCCGMASIGPSGALTDPELTTCNHFEERTGRTE